MKLIRRAAIRSAEIILAIGLAVPANARDAFEIKLDVSGQTGSRGYSSLESAVDTLSSTSGLQGLVPSYTDTSPATANVNLRGLPATANYATGSPVLRVIIPGAGIDKTFAGATRADSARLFRNFLQGQGASSSLFRALAAHTPTDPVAGNPNSLMNQMVGADFGRVLADANGASPAGVGLDARYGSFSASGFNSKSITLPIDYSWRLSARDVIEIDVPISATDTSGGKSYSGNIGVLWRHKVLTNWTLQPSLRIGGVGSTDLGSAAGVWSAAINSAVNFDLPAAWQLTVANGLTYISTVPVTIGKYSVDYNLSNFVFRNGFVASHDVGFRLFDLPTRGAFFFDRYAIYRRRGIYEELPGVRIFSIGRIIYAGAPGRFISIGRSRSAGFFC